MSFSPGLDTLERRGDLDDPSERLNDPGQQIFYGEAASPSEHFGDPWGGLRMDQDNRVN